MNGKEFGLRVPVKKVLEVLPPGERGCDMRCFALIVTAVSFIPTEVEMAEK